MKNENALTKKRMYHIIFFTAMLLVNEISWAQQMPVSSKSTDAEVEAYLKHKYKISNINIHTSYYDDERGRARTLFVIGELKPKTVPPGHNAREVAQAFFAEEALLFEMTPISEMREDVGYKGVSTSDQTGNIVLRYFHYINGIKVDGTETFINIFPDGTIHNLNTGMIPISPQLLEAVKKPTLSDQQIRAIIKKDMISSYIDPRLFAELDLSETVVPFSPYVLWKGDAQGEEERWLYSVDAFTGQIIEKTDYK